jgi:two-component system, LytTR family, response regulator LytT
LDESQWVQISQLLRHLLPPEASVAVANEYQYLDYQPGKYDIHIQPGTIIPQGSISAQVVTQKASVEGYMDASLFGVPYFGRGYPFQLENTWGAVTVIYPPDATSSRHITGAGGRLKYMSSAFDPMALTFGETLTPAERTATATKLPLGVGQLVQPATFVTGQRGESWRPVPVTDIAYFESYEKRNWMHTKDAVYTTIHTLHELETLLPVSFLRIHRSYIVNIDMINNIERGLSAPLSITLSTSKEQKLSVSQSYVREVRRRLGF